MKKVFMLVLIIMTAMISTVQAAGGFPEVKIDDRIKESGCPPCCPNNARSGIKVDENIADCGISAIFKEPVTDEAPSPVPVAIAPPVVKQAPVEKPQRYAEPAPAPALTPAKEKVTIALNVEFDTRKVIVKEKYYEDIKRVADFMKDNPEATCEIQGHTDNVGNDAANKLLSEKRADNVRQYIIDKFGINEKRITASGFGEELPIAGNDTEEGRKKNRRVEAVIEVQR